MLPVPGIPAPVRQIIFWAVPAQDLSALALQVMLAQRKVHRHTPVHLIASGDDILQVHPGGMTAFLSQTLYWCVTCGIDWVSYLSWI